MHAFLAAARMQELEQRDARQAAEAIAAAADLVALVVDRDIVPIGEFLADALVGFWIVAQELIERVVGEDDTEAESVVIPVLLDDLDVPARLRLLGQKGEIEAAGAAANDLDPHHSHSRPGYFAGSLGDHNIVPPSFSYAMPL